MNNWLLEFENTLYNDDDDDEFLLATSMLVLMVRGLFCKLNFPYAHVIKFGVQWDQYLHGLLWDYQNILHSSMGEKPSYLLFGFDCQFPTEAG